MRVHLVYPHGPAISCPDAIGRNLAARLAQRWPLATYDWDSIERIRPSSGDVLIGHPHPAFGTVFRQSARASGWARVIALAPYHHGDALQMAWADPVIRRCDHFLAITGTHWATTMGSSVFSHWLPRTTTLDLAVDRVDFPPIKKVFSPSGRRRVLYIGHTGWPKNTSYLSEIAGLLPNVDFAWAGPGRRQLPKVRALGRLDFSTPEAQATVAGYDFVISVSQADANPTTMIEAMAWGLIPICTRESGYVENDGVINIPLHDPNAAAARIHELNLAPDKELRMLQASNWAAVSGRWTWNRFGDAVETAIDDRSDRPPIACRPFRTMRLRIISLRSPFSPLRARNLAIFARSAVAITRVIDEA